MHPRRCGSQPRRECRRREHLDRVLDDFRQAFPAGAAWIGAVPAATQLGYAAGMLLLAPLGDRFDRRRLILLQIAGVCVALLVAATAPTLAVLIGASLAIGVLSTIAQQAVPFAAELAPPESRGHAVGTVMSGLLVGMAEPLPDDVPLEGSDALAKFGACAEVLERIIETIRERDADGVPFAPPFRLDDPSWVSNRLSEILQIPLRARQKLMELTDCNTRIDAVHHYMQQHQLL